MISDIKQTWLAIGVAAIAVAVGMYLLYQTKVLRSTIRRQARLLNALTPMTTSIPQPELVVPDSSEERVQDLENNEEEEELSEEEPSEELLEEPIDETSKEEPLEETVRELSEAEEPSKETSESPKVNLIEFAEGEGPHTMTVKNLKNLLKTSGVEIPENCTRKADLIGLIETHNKQNAG